MAATETPRITKPRITCVSIEAGAGIVTNGYQLSSAAREARQHCNVGSDCRCQGSWCDVGSGDVGAGSKLPESSPWSCGPLSGTNGPAVGMAVSQALHGLGFQRGAFDGGPVAPCLQIATHLCH